MVVTRRQSAAGTRHIDECECLPSSRTRQTASTSRGRSRRIPPSSNHNNSCDETVLDDFCTENSDTCITFRWEQIGCCCFYLIFILTCLLLTIVIYNSITSNSETLLRIEDLTADINLLRNEILTNQKYSDNPPKAKPPAIDSKLISNDLIQIIDNAIARENKKIIDELTEIKELLGKNRPDNSKSCDSQFDLILTRLDAMQLELSKQSSKTTTSLTIPNKPSKKNSPQIAEERVDYAAESLGGEILSTDDTQLLKMYYFGSIFGWIENTPRMIIQPSIFPGECYGFAGQAGSVVIKLMGRVFIDSVTVGHISKELSPSGDLNTAPRNITVSGLETPEDSTSTHLSTFEYDVNKNEQFQTFPVHTGNCSFQIIRFNFTSNYGNLNHTCVYRVRVHGKLDER